MKGWELIKLIDEGKIEQGSKIIVTKSYPSEDMFFDGIDIRWEDSKKIVGVDTFYGTYNEFKIKE